MKRSEVASLTYREMWETYVEPILKAQAEIRQQATGGNMTTEFEFPAEPMSIDQKVSETQSACMMFADPLEVGKAVRKSYGKKPDLEAMTAKLLARGNGVKTP